MLHYSIFLPDGIETAIQAVTWTVLAIFFAMTVLGWLVASKEWDKEEEASVAENRKEQNDEPGNTPLVE